MRKQEKGLAVAVFLGVAIAWIWFVTHPTGDTLPPGSVKIASVSDWQEPSNPSRPVPTQRIYFWTTNGDLLHLALNADGSTAVVRDHLTLFNTLQPDNAPPVQIPAGSLFLSPTPNGSGLLYGKTNALHSHDLDVHLLSSDGKTDRLLPALWTTNPAWMSDGKHWIANRMDGDYLNSLDGTPYRKVDTSSLSSWTPFVLGVNPQSRAVSTLGNDQFEPPTPYRSRVGLHYPTGVLTEFDPAAPTRNPKTWNVTMPPDSARGQLVLSPQADRILWIVEKQSSGLSAWFDHLQFANSRPNSGDQALAVSQLNGTGMKELFSDPTQRQRRGPMMVTVRPLSDIRWLPDGKRISFVYKDALYIAPVD